MDAPFAVSVQRRRPPVSDARLNGKAYGSPVTTPDIWGISKAFTARIQQGEGDQFDAYLERELSDRRARRARLDRRNAPKARQLDPPEHVRQWMRDAAIQGLERIKALRAEGAPRHEVCAAIHAARDAVDAIFVAWTYQCEPDESETTGDLFEEEA